MAARKRKRPPRALPKVTRVVRLELVTVRTVEDFHDRCKARLVQLGTNVSQLALAAGIPRTQLARWMRDPVISVARLARIEVALGVGPSYWDAPIARRRRLSGKQIAWRLKKSYGRDFSLE